MASPGINNGLAGSIATGLTYNNEFPQPGVDQPSQQFRDNNKVLQVGIENLQTKTIEVVIDTGSGTTTSGLVQIGSGLDPVTLTVPLSATFLSTSGGTLTGNLTMAAGTQITSPTNQNLTLNANGSGRLVLDGVSWPAADGTNGQVLTTNGAGNLSWSSRLISVQADTAPVLGGALNTDGFGIIGAPFLDLISVSQRIRVSGSGPGPADGVLSAGDAPNASNNPGGVLTLIGGTGNGVGAGGDVI
ncbi:MAG: hypothetical protein HC836_26170 [Richelia sp. RM2_1_2]|nr:hypothetical protein [Richelia sp. RM2_1_2]